MENCAHAGARDRSLAHSLPQVNRIGRISRPARMWRIRIIAERLAVGSLSMLPTLLRAGVAGAHDGLARLASVAREAV